MEIELLEVLDFLALYPPFSLLSPELRRDLPVRMEIQYARRGTEILTSGGRTDALHLIRGGAVEVHGPDGELLRRLGEGELFGAQALIRGGKVRNRVTAIEDALIYRLPVTEFQRLCQEDYAFAEFFVPLGADRLRSALRTPPRDSLSLFDLGSARVSDLAPSPGVTAPTSITIRQAAELLMLHQCSALLLSDGKIPQGIVTDRDITLRAVATGLPGELPVSTIMTPHPLSIDEESPAIDAMLLMEEQNINHLAVRRNGRMTGILTSADVSFKQLGSSPVYLVGRIHRLTDLAELREAAQASHRLLVSMTSANVTAQALGRTLTHLTDAITLRLIRMAEERLGRPPVAYAWMAGGSQGRQEQGAKGDQDNGLILDDAYTPAAHGRYFAEFSQFVCDGLDACGYDYCPGEMMASNAQWRQPARIWRDLFAQWIDDPTQQALMLSSVFFDLRRVHGDAALFDDLHRSVLKKARDNKVFLAHMADNALSRQPPLGFFRNLVLERTGEHAATLDLKLNGVIPIVDMARVYALETEVTAVNTWERLSLASVKGSVTPAAARDLSEAMEFIGATRFRHQARRAREGKIPNNHLSPEELSDFERQHLKDAFRVVRVMQRSLAHHHQIALLT
ncbi:MAG: cyclic nucleotide-binding/CBS domain-containing protein [Magnetococcales bacterium]|nr:cyclic nucleotide-binding/CBS domain-containing protein [Magnetococcales bacterium]